jgi:hypothetical protein
MQLSNGISNPMGLWLGHLMFDSISVLIVSTVVIILFAFLTPAFFGLGLLVRLFCYCFRLFKPLMVFEVAGDVPLRDRGHISGVLHVPCDTFTARRFWCDGCISSHHVCGMVYQHDSPVRADIVQQLYIGGLMIVLTYARPDEADGLIQIVHFTLSLLSPITSLVGLLIRRIAVTHGSADTSSYPISQPLLAPLQIGSG